MVIRIIIVGENLCEALDLRAGSRMLDVAAARCWCEVIPTDYVSSLLDSGRARATAEGHQIQFQEADAENLPFADAEFNVVLSTFAVMFTANQEQATHELARVCKPGGKIGLSNSTPESFIGQMFKSIAKYIPPAPGVKSPALWGTQAGLGAFFSATAQGLRVSPREFVFRYRPPSHWIEVFRTYYGPLNKTFGALDANNQAAFTDDLLTLMETRNRARDGTLVLPSEYLEVVFTRK